ncbi:hypothetical protein [Actinomadura roseirufa]|nr:hypothetical protein [Actinomadura roseirufa]
MAQENERQDDQSEPWLVVPAAELTAPHRVMRSVLVPNSCS